MQESDLSKLISGIRNGNNSYLEKIFIDHSSFCLDNLKRKTSCSHEEAEDILMDAVLNLQKRIVSGQITHLTNVRNYIFTSCMNMWIKEYDRGKSLNAKLPHIQRYYIDITRSSDDESYQKKMIEVSNMALEKINEKCQRLIKLFYLEKKNMEEIASILEYSSANVAKTSKLRCFKKLLDEVREIMNSQNHKP